MRGARSGSSLRGVGRRILIEPMARTLDVLRLENGRWVLLATHAADARVRAEPFDAVELELGALWADLTDDPSGAASL